MPLFVYCASRSSRRSIKQRSRRAPCPKTPSSSTPGVWSGANTPPTSRRGWCSWMVGGGGGEYIHIKQTLLSKATYNKYICQKKGKQQYIRCRYSKGAHRTKCQALTITRLTHSPATSKIDRIRCYTLWTIFKCQVVQHTISAYIQCQNNV